MFSFGDLAGASPPIIARQTGGAMTDKQFIEREIARFKASRRRRDMMDGGRYFAGLHDILRHRREAIGEGGERITLDNLPNSRIVDNQYRKLVNQKTNYIAGQPVTFQCEDKKFADALQEIFGRQFMRTFRGAVKNALNEGICFLLPRYDENGEFGIKAFSGHEIIPGWKDMEHTVLEYAIRLYTIWSYEGEDEKIVEKVEVYDEAGIHYFVLEGSELVPDPPYHSAYFSFGGAPYNWAKIPLVPIKRDSEETPLLRNVKSLQDGLNLMISSFQNNMEEDARNTILVLVNYDGENLGEFRRNLATYGAVKVKTVDGAAGDLRTLQVEVNAENYKAIVELFKKAIIENGMGYDAKDERMSGQPNQMNIQSMYSDIDLDANEMEIELQAAFEQLIWFVKCHLANTGAGDFGSETATVIFNRDILINETEAINNVRNSTGLLSEETLIAQHPWVDDPMAELERLKKQRESELQDDYARQEAWAEQRARQ